MSWSNLKSAVAAVIRNNDNQEITGNALQGVLNSIIDIVGENATFAGLANPGTNPGTPDGPVFYLASQQGTYSNFNNTTIGEGLYVFMWNGSTWADSMVFEVDEVPTIGSDNLVKSSGVAKKIIANALQPMSELLNGYLTNSHKYQEYSGNYYCALMQVIPGEKYIIKVSAESIPTDHNYYLFTSDIEGQNNIGTRSIYIAGKNEITAPDGASFLFVQIVFNTVGSKEGFSIYPRPDYIDEIEEEIQTVDEKTNEQDERIDALSSKVLTDDIVTPLYNNNVFKEQTIEAGYISGSSGDLALTGDGTYRVAVSVPVKPNTAYYLSRDNSDTNIASSPGIACTLNDNTRVQVLGPNGNILGWKPTQQDLGEGRIGSQFVTPPNAKSIDFTLAFVANPPSENYRKAMLEYVGVYNPLFIPSAYTKRIESGQKYPSIATLGNVSIFGGSVAKLFDTYGAKDRMSEILGCAIIDNAVPSAGLCCSGGVHTQVSGGVVSFPENSIPDQINNATSQNSDKKGLYIIWQSTNDFNQGIQLGAVDDYSREDDYNVEKLVTMCGGLNYCIKKLLEFSPSSRVLVISSLKEFDGSSYESTTGAFKTMVDTLHEVCKKHGTPFFNLWENSGINRFNYQYYHYHPIGDIAYPGSTAHGLDPVHPNLNAYNMLVTKIASFINNAI